MAKLRDVNRIIAITPFTDIDAGQMGNELAFDDACCNVQVVSGQRVRCAARLELDIVTEADPLSYQLENIRFFDIIQLILK